MQNDTTRKWSRKKLMIFAIVSVILVFIILELIARIYFYARFHGLHTSVYIQGSPLQTEDSITTYNNRAYYVDYRKEYQYNEEGMKSKCGDYRMPPKTSNDLWVLLLGGSAMEGMGSNKNDKWFDITNATDHPYNETIAAYLQQILQKQYTEKKVHIFNAAVTGFTINQSFRKYQYLTREYNFDWVISMDGVNELASVEENKTGQETEKNYWSIHPSNHFPLKYIIPVTQYSCIFNIIKQEIFYLRLNARIQKNIKNNFPERRFWLQQPVSPIQFVAADNKAINAVHTYMKEVHAFEKRLKEDNKKYLLLTQPYLAFRPEAILSKEEIPLKRYSLKEYNDGYRHFFLKNIYDSIKKISPYNPHIQAMTVVHSWPGWIFVDYCHFTAQANARIAQKIAEYIISGGERVNFNN